MIRGGLGGPEDRRRHVRYEILAQVHVRYADADFVLELTNVSRSGALVHFGTLRKPRWVVRGRRLELSIIVPTALDTIDTRGRIVRVERKGKRWGFAVEFEPLPRDQEEKLRRLLELGRPQPPPLPATPQPPPLPATNRRRHERYELLAAVRAPRVDEDLVLELTNVSRSGALVHLGSLDQPEWLETGETVELAIVDPESLDLVEVAGTVVRVDRRGPRLGFGVQFHPLDDTARAGVARLCALGRPQPPAPPSARAERGRSGS